MAEGLHFYEATVVSAKFHELVVGALFNNAAFVHHAYHIGILDGRQAVGYDYGGAVFHQSVECLLHEYFAL